MPVQKESGNLLNAPCRKEFLLVKHKWKNIILSQENYIVVKSILAQLIQLKDRPIYASKINFIIV